MHPAGVASVAARRTLLDSAWGRKRAMATGSSTQITKQRGEYLVAAELGKFGYFAATFSGSVPDFDIVAVDQDGRSVVCQVKAIAGPSWQFDARKFLEIEHDGPAQRVVAAQTLRFPDMPWVMVKLDDEGPPIYYVLRHRDVQAVVRTRYTTMLEKHGGVRPKNSLSTHTAIWPKDIETFREKWTLIEASLGTVPS